MEGKESLKNLSGKEKEKQSILLLVLKKHKLGIAFVFFFLFASVTWAWFIYNKTVDLDLHAHVKTWDVYLGDDQTGDTYSFQLSDLFPGMPNATDEVDIVNNGEMNATVGLQIEELYMFGVLQVEGTDYTVSESNGVYTISGYPFDLSFTLGSTTLNANGTTTLNFLLTWPYSRTGTAGCTADADGFSVCDEEDTALGEQSYQFSQTHPDDPSLQMQLKLNIVQE